MQLAARSLVSPFQHHVRWRNLREFRDAPIIADERIVIEAIERRFAEVHYAIFADGIAVFLINRVLGILHAFADHAGVKCLEIAHGRFLLTRSI